MSEDLSEGEKNFRSSYYESLGFRSGEKSLSYLEALLKAEAVDVDKLKVFCLKHTLPAYYRPLVWKIILGVVPPHNDEETTSFVKTQKLQRLHDLKHTLKVMGKLPSQLYAGYEATQSISPTIQTSSPEDLVSIYLLENNRILSSSMRQEWQVDLTAIAQHFVNLFEVEVEAYWLFSTFAQRWESQLCDIGSLQVKCLQYLDEADCTLHRHIKPLRNGLPFNRWFSRCFATVLPESCLESIWDKVIGGSSMILVYVTVAILLSLKRQIMNLRTVDEISKLLTRIPPDNFNLITSKALEMWESHGSPTQPSTPEKR